MENVPTNWINYIFASVVAALLWFVRGSVSDVKHIKSNYVTREEVTAAIAAHQAATAKSFEELRDATDSRHTENTANFRELRMRLDNSNDTLLKIALQLKPDK